nr:hypothetical protein BaRGS_023412 [Batillaria attramentaria]
MKSSVPNIYIMTLTAMDTVIMIANIPFSSMDVILKGRRVFPVAYAYFRLYFELPVQQGVRNVASVVTSLMTLDRFVTIAFTMKASEKGLLRVPVITSVILSVVSLAGRVASLVFQWHVVEVVDRETNATSGATLLLSPTFARHEKLISGLNLAQDTLFRYVPVLIMIVANFGLLAKLASHTRSMRGMSVTSQSSDRRSRGAMRSAVVVSAYSSVYLVLALPITVFRVTNVIMPDMRRLKPEVYQLLMISLPFPEVLSSGVNFFVYFAATRKFRSGLKKLLRGEAVPRRNQAVKAISA